MSENTPGDPVFFQTYGNLYSIYQAEDDEKSDAAQPAGHPREQALETLPQLLAERADRERLLTLLDRLIVDERVTQLRSTPGQLQMVQRIREVLASTPGNPPHLTPVR